MKVLQYLNGLRPAIPFSIEQPHSPMTNGELRRHLQQGGVKFNGEKIGLEEEVDFPVFSLVFFPNSTGRKTTLI